VPSEEGDNDPSWWDDRNLLMAVDIGYDEGGEGRKPLLVSMQLATVVRAKKLKKHWRLKLGQVPFFHAKDFNNFSGGVFQGLTPNQRSGLLAKPVTLIHRHVSIGLTAEIDCDLYDSITDQPFRSRWGTAYTFAIDMLAVFASMYLRETGQGSEVNILIEGGHRNSEQARQFLDLQKIANDFDDTLSILTVGIGDKKNHPILQAADMLAYSEWQKIQGKDSEIYSAIRKPSRYVPFRVILNEDLIRRIKGVHDKREARRRAFGQRTIKEILSDERS
jgi:hypothetical protein